MMRVSSKRHALFPRRFPVFRLLYSTTFTVLVLILLGLLLITPADGIYQSYLNNQLWNVVFIAGVYFLTLVIALFVYATRLYTTRTHLASIPKSYVPIRKADLRPSVRKLIVEGLARSASIAYNAHPRDLRQEKEEEQQQQEEEETAMTIADGTGAEPTWGTISHPGWSSPSSPDLPNVQYEPVLLELAHLIEAKAVSLAPPDPLSVPTPTPNHPHPQPAANALLPDPVAVALLQRPAALNLRDYLSHLSSLAMFQDPSLPASFILQYESARFSARPLSEASFRKIMDDFSALLRSMCSPDATLLEAAVKEAAGSSSSSSSINHLAVSGSTSSSSTTPTTRSRSVSRASSVLRQMNLAGSSSRSPNLQRPSKRSALLKPTIQRPPSSTPGSSSGGAALTSGNTPYLTPYLSSYPASQSSNDGDREENADEDDDDEDENHDSGGSERSAHTAWTRRPSIQGLHTPTLFPHPTTPSYSHRSPSFYSTATGGLGSSRATPTGGAGGQRRGFVGNAAETGSYKTTTTADSDSDAGSVRRRVSRGRRRNVMSGGGGTAQLEETNDDDDDNDDGGSIIVRRRRNLPAPAPASASASASSSSLALTSTSASGGSVVRREELGGGDLLPLPLAANNSSTSINARSGTVLENGSNHDHGLGIG